MKNKKFNEMVQYIHFDSAEDGRLLFDTCDVFVSDEEIISYLKDNLKNKFNHTENFDININIFMFENDIITGISLDVETSTALLTFFDDSQQTVRVCLDDLSLETLKLYSEE